MLLPPRPTTFLFLLLLLLVPSCSPFLLPTHHHHPNPLPTLSSSSFPSPIDSSPSPAHTHTSFRTLVPVPPRPLTHRVHPSDPLLFIGSCFSENIGHKFQDLFFSVEINPFGIAYNPVSIERCVERLVSGKRFDKGDLGQHPSDGRWYSFEHHTSFSAMDPNEALAHMNKRLEQGQAALRKAKHVFITLGSAHAYVLKEEKARVVANCHRLPASFFERKLLSVQEVAESLQATIQHIRSVNPHTTITFTVSPVRHLRNAGDAIQSSRSKAHLLAAVHEVLDEAADHHFPPLLLSYFPAYELVMDDLRDYRFYASDMLHPSPLAIEYIWGKLAESYLDTSTQTQTLLKELGGLRRNLGHRPFDPNSKGHQGFLRQQLETMKRLEEAEGGEYLDFKEARRALVEGGLLGRGE